MAEKSGEQNPADDADNGDDEKCESSALSIGPRAHTAREEGKQGVAAEKPHIALRYRVYRGIVMNENEVEKIQVMAVRPDDIWVCSFPRSGTTLTQELTYLIMTGDYETAKKVQLDVRFPMIDLKDDRFPYYKGVQYVEDMASPRLIKCHLHYFLTPEELRNGKGRLIYCTRNPKDTIWSLYRVFQWTKYHTDEDISFQDFFDFFLKGENVYCGPWWAHVRGYWEHRDDENVLVLKYEETIKDMPGTVRRIADFLGKSLTDEDVAKICRHCGLESMRTNDMVNLSYYRDIKTVNDDCGGFINKGKTGVWRDVLTEDMSRRVDEMMEREFKGLGLSYDED